MTGPAGLAARRAAAAARGAEQGPVQPITLFVYGMHQDASFQMVKAAAEYLAAEREGVEAVVEGFFETPYEQHLRHMVSKFGGSFTQSHPSRPLVYAETDDQVLYFTDANMFLEWTGKRFKYEAMRTEEIERIKDQLMQDTDAGLWQTELQKTTAPDDMLFVLYKHLGNASVKGVKDGACRSYCAISICVGSAPKETVQLELFDEESPILAVNFLKLLALPKFDGHPLHRVKGDCWIQAGDLVDGSGMNSEAAETGLLRHESFRISHDRPGLLGMCCHGKDTVGSQFYITLRQLPFLDGKFCVIGRVICGMETIQRIAKLPTKNERPLQDVKIFAESAFTHPKATQPK
eukprot:TRINITY_DN7510_c0_g1_i3.p1 TRINITY_DN7510_c0_g1~~TRINITY_DN7510_c0_g1_i3.p1  ORF type:complete len:376 (-),score=78.88 TRINITY_DN7510_c0_g1_i3:307-1350(-)